MRPRLFQLAYPVFSLISPLLRGHTHWALPFFPAFIGRAPLLLDHYIVQVFCGPQVDNLKAALVGIGNSAHNHLGSNGLKENFGS